MRLNGTHTNGNGKHSGNGSATPVRVGFVVHLMQVAGAEVLVSQTIRRLGPRINPTVFCLDAIGTLGEKLRDDGVEVVCLGRRPGRDFGVAGRMAQEIRRREIEVLHAHQYTPFFYAALAKAWSGLGTRLILTEHGRHFPDLVSPLRRATNRMVLDRLADAVNAVCDFSARSLCQVDGFAGRRMAVIANGVELDRYGPTKDRAGLRCRLGLDATRRYIVCIARFHPVKDHGMLLRAFQEVARSRADVDLLLVGDGPLRNQLEESVLALGIKDRVRFLGVRFDVPDILRAADVFTLTSISEAASLTVLEAMASALPVVVTAVGGNPEMVRHGVDGLLVPRGDAGATAAALGRLLDEPETAANFGVAARQRVQENYRIEQTIGAYFRLYRELAGRQVSLAAW